MKMNKGIFVLVIVILVGSCVGMVSATTYLTPDSGAMSGSTGTDGSMYVVLEIPDSYKHREVIFDSISGCYHIWWRKVGDDYKQLGSSVIVDGPCATHNVISLLVAPGEEVYLKGRACADYVGYHKHNVGITVELHSPKQEVEMEPESKTITTKIYVRNEDDDNLRVTLIQGIYYVAETLVLSGETKFFGSYTLDVNSAPSYEINWKDPDRRTFSNQMITFRDRKRGIDGTITFVVDRNVEEAKSEATLESERKIVPEPESKRKSYLQPRTRVYVRNRDNDPVTAELFIWGNQITEKNISAGATKYFGAYETSRASAFSVYWYEPDSDCYIWTDAEEIDDNSTIIVLEPPVDEEEPDVEVPVREEEIPEEIVLEEIVIEQIIPEEVVEEPAPKFKDIMPDNPSAAKGIIVAGISVQNAEDYEKAGKYFLLEDYVSETPATTWEDVARYQYYSGKRYFKISEIEGDLKVTHKILKLADKLLSLGTTMRKLGGHYKTLDSSTFKEITSDSNLVAGFAGDMTYIYIETSKTDSEVMKFICTASTTYTSKGLNAYIAVCDRINSEITQSEAYHLEKGTIAYSRAYHAMCIHNIAIKEVVSDQEIEEYFFHVDMFLKLQKMSYYLDSRERRTVWGGTGLWSRTSLTIMTDVLGATTEESRLAWLKEYEAAIQRGIDYLDGNIEYMTSLKDSGLEGGA